MKILSVALSCLALGLIASPSSAAVITATSYGVVDLADNSFGGIAVAADGANGWFAFDLPTGDFETATLSFSYTGTTQTIPANVFFYDVSTSLSALQSPSAPGAFADLGSGSLYGNQTIYRTSETGSPYTFTLNVAALADINASAGSSFVIGFSYPSAAQDRNSSVFLGLLGNPISLELTESVAAVPEPSTWAMMILGFAGVGFMAYRRRAVRETAV